MRIGDLQIKIDFIRRNNVFLKQYFDDYNYLRILNSFFILFFFAFLIVNDVRPINGHSEVDLQRRLKELEEENRILKKAMHIFAKD